MNETEFLDLLGGIQIAAERAAFATNELINDYGFSVNPDPKKALIFGRGIDKTGEAEQSFSWYMEYNRVYTLVEIANDYITEIKKLAASAVKA